MSASDVTPASELISYLTSHYEGVDVTTYPPDAPPTAWFFSLDPETHWPNFATVVTTDEHDMEDKSNLEARAAYRLNIGVGRPTFERLVDAAYAYDYTATDMLMPHPVYAKQLWVAVVNPTRQTFESTIKPLLDEAYSRLARGRPQSRGDQ
jgi:hypothetical protein